MNIPEVLGRDVETARKILADKGFSKVNIISYQSPKGGCKGNSRRVVRQRVLDDYMKSVVELVVCEFLT